MILKDIWRKFDLWLFGVVLILSIFGVAMISSAIAGNPTLVDHPQRQIIFLVIGIVVLFIATAFDYHYWLILTTPLYLITLAFLIFVFVSAQARFGAARWLEVGLILIQPAELAKIVVILALARFFSRNVEKIGSVKVILQSIFVTGGIVVWILLQPNLSTSIVIFVIWFAMLWISGLKTKIIVIVSAIAIIFLIISAFMGFSYLAEYQQNRIKNFFNPEEEARYGDTYNVDQALISIGSGGLLGQGYGQGTQVQLRYLKIRHNDFIFSAIANEFGFVGTTLVILLLLFVVYRCFRIAQKASDTYGALIAYGFGVLIAFQSVVNIGVNLNILPVTALTLPFISYGGSSLLSLLLGIGLVESVKMRSEYEINKKP
jgi:rod shape determining protein RodA